MLEGVNLFFFESAGGVLLQADGQDVSRDRAPADDQMHVIRYHAKRVARDLDFGSSDSSKNSLSR